MSEENSLAEFEHGTGFRTGMMTLVYMGHFHQWRLRQILRYAFLTITYGGAYHMLPRNKRKTPVNIDQTVDKWMPVLRGLALAHDKDEEDRFEAQVNECLSPLLAAPRKQVVEFYNKLLAAMKTDKDVPYLVWRTFEIWGEHFVIKAPDEGIKRLKRKLAAEIVDLVEADVKVDFRDAMIRALMWRDPETLEEVKEAVIEGKAQGRKPRLKGKESCLFLTVSRGRGKRPACVQV
jgi:hypothetical protein